MPIYEFLCRDCNRVFSFLARTAGAAGRKPKCPKCDGRKMNKLFSRFATARKSRKQAGPSGAEGGEHGGPDSLSPGEEARMERTMMELARDMESMDEDDPRQLAAAMRRVSDVTGEDLGPEMDEMMRRLEAGEDPEKVEEDMADAFPDEGPAGGPGGSPTYDDGLYDL